MSIHYKTVLNVKNEFNDPLSPLVKVYQLWKGVFEDTFKIIKGDSFRLCSDDFLIQDGFCSLFDGHKCFATIAFRESTTYNEAEYNRSYYHRYPNEILSSIRNKYKKTFTITNLAIDKDYRKNSNYNLNFSDVLVGLCVYKFIESTSDAILTVTRNSKKVNGIFCSYGGKVVKSLDVHGETSDLILITKKSAIEAISNLTTNLRDIIDQLKDEGINGIGAPTSFHKKTQISL